MQLWEIIGVITQAQEASFRSEMAAVKEAVHMRIASNVVADAGKIQKIEYEPVPLEDGYKWKSTLRIEIAFWRDYSEFENIPKDVSDLEDRSLAKWVSKITENNNNFGAFLSAGDNVRGIYYVKESGHEEKKYIYDEVYDIVYKIPVTRISKYKVHSVEELDYQKNNIKQEISKKTDYTLVSQTEVTTKKVGNVTCYEPDLNNLAQEATKLIFYKVNGTAVTTTATDIKEMTISDWISGGRPNEITENSNKYVLYDYENKIWANIKVVNTKGTEDTGDDVESWWTWIPRYAYKNTNTTTEIKFINTKNNLADETENNSSDDIALPEGYTVAKAFEGNSRKGIWISKYEVTAKTTTNTGDWAYYIPDLSGLKNLETNNTEIYLAIYNDNATSFVDYKNIKEVTNLSTFAKENKFFDYYTKKWANIKIVNTKGTDTIEDDVESWWVWIPRYAYYNSGSATDIIFVDTDNDPIDGSMLPGTYKIPKAFEGNTKKGIWVSKYEVTAKSTVGTRNVNTAPDLTGLVGKANIDVYLELYNNNKTGFTSKPIKYTSAADIETAKSNNWYDYSQKAWANVKVVNNMGTPSNTNDDIESWWVWIPRYAYKNTGDVTEVILIGINNKDLDGNDLPQGYTVAKVFEGNAKTGIWISKYEVTEK